jgi:splicing factor 3B subunit 1
VREVYWKIYNNMYLGAQDALVAVYPSFPDDPKTGNVYKRYELELMM